MFNLPVRTWILNAAAVLSGRHGAVTGQAEQAGCSRQTVYEHAHKLERRLAEPDPEVVARLRAENQRLPQAIAALQQAAEARPPIDKDTRRRLATTAFAMGLSPRQIEELLAILLPPELVPDHSTLGHWVQDEARRAGEVRAALDPACADRIATLAIDEVFFGGDRPRSGSSRRA
jgi:hypothetical protein